MTARSIGLRPGGAPVGMFPDSNYEEGVVQLDPGDLVIAYTDGVVEAANPEGEEWGVQGLLKAATAGSPTRPREVLKISSSRFSTPWMTSPGLPER